MALHVEDELLLAQRLIGRGVVEAALARQLEVTRAFAGLGVGIVNGEQGRGCARRTDQELATVQPRAFRVLGRGFLREIVRVLVPRLERDRRVLGVACRVELDGKATAFRVKAVGHAVPLRSPFRVETSVDRDVEAVTCARKSLKARCDRADFTT